MVVINFVILQSSDPVINTDNDDTLMLKLKSALLEGGVGRFTLALQIFETYH